MARCVKTVATRASRIAADRIRADKRVSASELIGRKKKTKEKKSSTRETRATKDRVVEASESFVRNASILTHRVAGKTRNHFLTLVRAKCSRVRRNSFSFDALPSALVKLSLTAKLPNRVLSCVMCFVVQ